MSLLAVRLSRAIERGRHASARPRTRAALLAALLQKRAAAYAAGEHELEAMLRDQIRWALPVEPVQAASASAARSVAAIQPPPSTRSPA